MYIMLLLNSVWLFNLLYFSMVYLMYFFSILLSSNPMPSLFVFYLQPFSIFFYLAKKFLNFFGFYDMLLPESGNVPLSTFRKRAKKDKVISSLKISVILSLYTVQSAIILRTVPLNVKTR